jgi:hypothetical protein
MKCKWILDIKKLLVLTFIITIQNNKKNKEYLQGQYFIQVKITLNKHQ